MATATEFSTEQRDEAQYVAEQAFAGLKQQRDRFETACTQYPQITTEDAILIYMRLGTILPLLQGDDRRAQATARLAYEYVGRELAKLCHWPDHQQDRESNLRPEEQFDTFVSNMLALTHGNPTFLAELMIGQLEHPAEEIWVSAEVIHRAFGIAAGLVNTRELHTFPG